MSHLSKIILVLFSFSIFSCINYEAVELVSVDYAELISLSPNGAEFKITATVNNPNEYNINLETKDLNLYLNDNYLGNANFKNKVKLNKNSIDQYEVIVVSTIPADGNIDIGTITATALFSGLKIKVEGDIKASAKGLSKTIAVSFTEQVEM